MNDKKHIIAIPSDRWDSAVYLDSYDGDDKWNFSLYKVNVWHMSLAEARDKLALVRKTHPTAVICQKVRDNFVIVE